jgi:hypothetical protein|tara:strand:- start:10735 stop:10941 length:207 start_codon:yes stop_codon:yes gene_type:complete
MTRNRIAAITRWPLDREEALERARVEIVFFRVMRDLFGERFMTQSNLSRYRKATRVYQTLTEEPGAAE